MARMYPSEPSDFNNSKAEKILFGALKNQLPHEYAVVHSKKWIDRDQKKVCDKQGESDFIILHPSIGMLFIEAKSGENFHGCGIDKYWSSGNGNSIKNPIHQASSSQYRLIKFIKKNIGDMPLPHNFALAFPDANNIDKNLLIEILPEMIILKPDLKSLKCKIESAINAIRNPLPQPISNNHFNRILTLIRAEFRITASLRSSLDALDEQFFQLEECQTHTLNQFEKNRHVIVEGCAGSGKTLLAIEKARRASKDGKSVLLLCYNQLLSYYLDRRLKELKTDVDVFNFHGLCEYVISQTGGIYEPDKSNLREFYDRTAPQLLSDSISQFAKRYDSIIVDEAQDFIEDWWYPITDLQRNHNSSEFYIFRDPVQNIFLRQISQPFEDNALITLDHNCRNTPAIIRWINNRCQTKIGIPLRVQEGIAPAEIRIRNDEQELKETENVINQLVHKEKISPRKIVILGKHSLKKSVFKNESTIGGLNIVEDSFCEPRDDQIIYSSVYRFKGLEADCVLFTGVGSPATSDIKEDPKAVLLTGASRAKKLLYVFHRNSLNANIC